jgi:hypothetical protein
MAEHFRGKNLTIHFTNGGGESLFRMWVAVAEKLILEPEMEDVTDYLHYCLEECCDGTRAFDFAPPPPALESPANLFCLSKIVEFCVRELAKDSPDIAIADCGCNWDKELRLSWLSKMLDLHEMIRDAFPSNLPSLEPIKITLPHEDEIAVKIPQLFRRKAELNSRRHGTLPTLAEELQIINQIIALNLQLTPPGANQLLYLYGEQSSLLADLGRHEEALESLYHALKYETDPELQNLLKRAIDEAPLSSSTRAPTARRRLNQLAGQAAPE